MKSCLLRMRGVKIALAFFWPLTALGDYLSFDLLRNTLLRALPLVSCPPKCPGGLPIMSGQVSLMEF